MRIEGQAALVPGGARGLGAGMAQALTAASRSAAVASAWAPREIVIAEFLTSLARAPREGIGGEPSDPWTELRRNPLRHCLPVPRNRLS